MSVSGGRVTFDEALTRFQRSIFITFSLIGNVTLYVFGVLHIATGDQLFNGYFQIALGTIILLNFFSYLQRNRIEPHATIIVIVMIFAYSTLVFTGGLGNTGIVWIYTLPIVTFGLKRTGVARYWVFAFLVLLATLLVLQMLGYTQTAYDAVQLRQYILSVGVLALLIYLFARFLESREQIFVQQDKELYRLTKKLKQTLRTVDAERAKIQALFQSIGDGVVAIDSKGNTLLANPSAHKLLGFQKSELVGKPFAKVVKLVHGDGTVYKKRERPSVQAMKAGSGSIVTTPANLPHFFVTKDGQPLPVAISAAPITMDETRSGVVVAFRDVTDELALAKEKTEFVSIASHQLRTPLTGLKWTMELVEQERLRKDAKEAVLEAQTSLSTMIKLVGDLLNVSRIEIGTIRFEPKRTEMLTLLKSIIAEVRPLADEKGQKISLKKPDGNKLYVTTDPSLYRQVLHNFLTNAIRYSKKGGNISITFDQQSDKLVTRVQDSGIGIPKTAQDQIFTKFYRADNAKSESNEGTGLGLYFVKMAADVMGGGVGFTSEENIGSTFFIELPKKD